MTEQVRDAGGKDVVHGVGPAAVRRDLHNLHFTLRQAIKNTFSVWILAGFIAGSAWRELSPWLSVSWVALVGVAFTLRIRLLRDGQELAAVELRPEYWRRCLNVSTPVCGGIAASGALLYFPSISDSARMYISMIYCGWLAGAMSSLGARPKLYTAYGVIFVTGLTAAWFSVGSEFRYEVMLMLVLFVAITSGFARSFAMQVNESIEIRYANERLVESLRTAHAAAEESSAAKSRFLAVASHDLRQPLHAVTLLNGLLARPQGPERISAITVQMGRALSTLERLFNSVLDFSKIDTNKVKPDLRWHDLSQSFAMLQSSYSAAMAQKGLELVLSDLNVAIRTDADLLDRILGNLVDNAFKFTVQGKVEISAQWVGSDAEISVTDTGPGIPANLRAEVFKEYFQVNSDRRSTGLGLGLAIVRRLSELLGLRVEVQDAEPCGSRFVIHIPAAMVRSLEEPISNWAVEDSVPLLDGFFVAYVDDDASSREALAWLLDDWGCKYVMAATLDDLMQQLTHSEAPSAVLTDFSLGNGVTGLDVIQAVRLKFGAVSAAILTGDVSAIEMEKLGDLEFPVLRKPVAAKELKDLLEVFKSIG